MFDPGYYRTKGGFVAFVPATPATIVADIVADGQIITVLGVGLVGYLQSGQFAYKGQIGEPDPGDCLDLVIQSRQPYPFEDKGIPNTLEAQTFLNARREELGLSTQEVKE